VRGGSPRLMPQPVIVSCTAPNNTRAPVPAAIRVYANAKA
jgi:hypothetical protein